MSDELIKVGTYNTKFNDILNLDISESLEIFRSKGLPSHILSRKHYSCIKYIDYIPDIISNPDYIGINPNEKDISFELVKRYKNNIMIGIKIDRDNDNLYVSTMIELQESKLNRRLYSGRLKEISVDKND